jgi:hypothetical protein
MFTTFTAELPKALAQAVAEQPTKMYLYLEYTNSSGNVPAGYTSASAISSSFANPKTYYSGLTNANFLRVSAVRDPNVVSTVNGSVYTTTTTFFGQSTAATNGVLSNGQTFGNTSICYGAALVLALDEADRTKDLIIGRSYFVNGSEYITKTASSQVFVTFPFTTTVTAP